MAQSQSERLEVILESEDEPQPLLQPSLSLTNMPQKTLLKQCMQGMSAQEAPFLQALSILKKLQSMPTEVPDKVQVDYVLDKVLNILENTNDVWIPNLKRKQTMSGNKAYTSELRDWLVNETTTYLLTRDKRRTRGFTSRDPAANQPNTQDISRRNAQLGRRLSISNNSLLTAETAKRYSKKIHVHAFRTGAKVEVLKSWGVSVGTPRDWIIISQQNDIYTCSEQVFAQTYEAVPGLLNTYRKTGFVYAVKKMRPFSVPTANGEEHGQAGDYLVQSVSGEQWVISAPVFESTYELDEIDSSRAQEFPGTYHMTELSASEQAQVDAILGKPDNWKLDVTSLQELTKGHAFFWVARHVFNAFELISKFDIHEANLEGFLLAAEAKHASSNQFHNALHAADCLWSMYYFLKTSGMRSYLNATEILACVMATVIHDIGHPGYDSNFLITTEHELAILYNHQSVLENHHCSLGFRTIKQYNIFQRMSDFLRRKVRRMTIDLVFSTDLTTHFDLLTKWNDKVKKGTFDPKQNQDDKIMMMKLALKAADFSFFAKSKPVFRTWADRLQKEFFNQGDMEKSLGYRVSPFMDRMNPQTNALFKAYINYIARPLFQALTAFIGFDKEGCKEMLENLYHNMTTE